ncbi:MAG: hypothetical protein R3B72_19760 [Polyangiaceae bacterium]
MMRFALVVITALATGALGGCRCEPEGGGPPPVASAKAPVPVPEGLAADLTVADPQAFFERLRTQAGGPLLLMPRTFGGLVVNLFGLPLTAADLVDEHLAAVGAVRVSAAGVEQALAIHVRDGGRFVSAVTAGADAGFVARRAGEITWLDGQPKLREASLPVTLGVVDHYLVAGNDAAAVEHLGLYLARTAAPVAKTEHDLEVKVADGPLRELVASRLSALQLLGLTRQSLPAPLTEMGGLDDALATFGDLFALLGAGQASLDLRDGRLDVQASFAARDDAARSALAARPTTQAKPLLDLPDDTVVAVTWAQSAKSREAAAGASATAILTALSIAKADREGVEPELSKALTAIAEGRGDDTMLAARCTGVGITGMLRGGSKDAERLTGGLEALLALREREPIARAFEEAGVQAKASTTRARHIPDDVHLLRLERAKTPADEDAPPAIDLRYVVTAERYYAAAGMESLDTLQLLHQPDPDHAWRQREAIAAFVDRLPDAVWLGVVADPQGVHACFQGKPGGSFATPLTLTVRPGAEGGLALRLEATASLLRVAAQQL